MKVLPFIKPYTLTLLISPFVLLGVYCWFYQNNTANTINV